MTHDPYPIQLPDRKNLSVDLAAEKIIEAEKGSEKIAVEVKSFLSDSFMRDFYEAYGQYSFYRDFIHEQEAARTPFLAIEENVYNNNFRGQSISSFCQRHEIKIIIFNASLKTIVKWEKQEK